MGTCRAAAPEHAPTCRRRPGDVTRTQRHNRRDLECEGRRGVRAGPSRPGLSRTRHTSPPQLTRKKKKREQRFDANSGSGACVESRGSVQVHRPQLCIPTERPARRRKPRKLQDNRFAEYPMKTVLIFDAENNKRTRDQILNLTATGSASFSSSSPVVKNETCAFKLPHYGIRRCIMHILPQTHFSFRLPHLHLCTSFISLCCCFTSFIAKEKTVSALICFRGR